MITEANYQVYIRTTDDESWSLVSTVDNYPQIRIVKRVVDEKVIYDAAGELREEEKVTP